MTEWTRTTPPKRADLQSACQIRLAFPSHSNIASTQLSGYAARMKWTTGGPVPRKFDITVDDLRLIDKTISGLSVQYRRHYDQNGLRLPVDWEDRIWTVLASTYPRHVKRAPGVAKRRSVSIGSALNFIRFLAKRVTDKSLVPPQEAHRRASICRACPMATNVSGCHICKDALVWTVHPPEAVVAPEACSACGCYLPLKIWVPRSQLGDVSAFDIDPKCWMYIEDYP